ncbi:hypothetical protein QTG54_004691 [Skeletonema marinoi]|uniref:MYND-type domain-containing protein n=1 Tax=Skeletonema marinoi TaxID=267567 RepID=A0A7S2Q3N5_9STRA|nr:hypothetical protein QTG54_004691 [Skeletonema marinoi]|mmetsp:Transcript_37804/g.77350  ORF Transcript_37804/g.77350 Transcript_37804/m.77350 type:complete len:585 (-) Transcript_37804:42-1796(-)
MSGEEFALRMKEQGNVFYREKKYDDALCCWGSALGALPDRTSPLAITIRSNSIMAYLASDLYERVVKESTLLLEDDPRHAKSLARRGTAREKLASNRGSSATFQQRKEFHNQAVEDMNTCIELLNSNSETDPGQERLKRECEQSLERLSKLDDDYYTRIAENLDNSSNRDNIDSGLGRYLSMNLTPLGEHPRIPKSSMRFEMLAVRLMAALETTQRISVVNAKTGEEAAETKLDYSERGKDILNQILTTAAQVPFCLFPATGSTVRCPPITVHLLAFYMRTCLSEKAWKEFKIEEFCEEATSQIISDDEAYAIATHGYHEVEDRHSPLHGHGKAFAQSARGCMPCCFRLTRGGAKDWAAGLQQAVHFGKIEGAAFVLNRLLERIDGKSLVPTMLESDQAGCNTMMHAANDMNSGFSWLSIRMLVHAASFSTVDPTEKEMAVRTVLNKSDNFGFTPALASCSLVNKATMETFAQVGARLHDKRINGKQLSKMVKMHNSIMRQFDSMGEDIANLTRALKATSDELCSYCGRSPEKKLLSCGRCFLAKYCSGVCQKKHYKKHKFVCSSAKVDQDLDWFASNVSAPRP